MRHRSLMSDSSTPFAPFRRQGLHNWANFWCFSSQIVWDHEHDYTESASAAEKIDTARRNARSHVKVLSSSRPPNRKTTASPVMLLFDCAAPLWLVNGSASCCLKQRWLLPQYIRERSMWASSRRFFPRRETLVDFTGSTLHSPHT